MEELLSLKMCVSKRVGFVIFVCVSRSNGWRRGVHGEFL